MLGISEKYVIQPLVVNLKEDGYFTTKRGGDTFRIMRRSDGWGVTVTNSTNTAWNNGLGKVQEFDSLEAVEDHYQTLRGFSNVVALSAIPASYLYS